MLSLQIREETDTKIELPSEGSDSDMIVITGHKAQVEAARDRIVAIQNELVRVLLSSSIATVLPFIVQAQSLQALNWQGKKATISTFDITDWENVVD